MAQTQTQTQLETVRGTVDRTNDKGITLEGRDGWLNFSQFHQVPRPERGQDVEVLVAKGRFINGLKILAGMGLGEIAGADAPAPDFGEAAPVDDDDPGTWGYGSGKGSAAPRPVRQAAPAPAPVKATGRATLRAAALAAAAHFHSGKADSTEDAVYETALRFVAFLEDGD